ncbi:hypothetical protein [Microbacterium sp. No. 7]|uniref:hypothetical protein n=1 Tax=Microbacterium sp. No. 7 TaxID=1714373 RepID=UPI003FA52B71
MIEPRRLRVALLGAGAVGSQVARLLLTHADELADRAGAPLDSSGSPSATSTPAPSGPSRDLFTTDADTLIAGADIVIEVTGGLEPARTRILHALSSGADVVTANKALLRPTAARSSTPPTRSGHRRLRGGRRRRDPDHPAAP